VRDQVLESCVEFAGRLCSSASSCCTQTAGDFDPEACVSSVMKEVCIPAADAVGAGIATYDEAAVEPCLAAHARSHDACVADFSTLIELRRDIWSACKVVRGSAGAGRGCTTSITCAQPDGASVGRCVTGTCRVLTLLKEGEACPYPSGEVSVCDEGLYCSAAALGETGECRVATAGGDACDPVPLNAECGLGSYCDSLDGLCHKADKLGGTSCEQAAECVSFNCDRIIGECTTPLATVAELCPAVL
jgi:hypothetical protein